MLRDALVLLTFWCCAGAASGAPIADQPQPELQYRQTIVAPAADRTHLAGNTLAVGGLADGGGACTNPIACENLLPGAAPTEWNIAEPGDSSILGFATQPSVSIGDTVRFKIKSSALAYHIDIFRAGWYQGNGARKVASGIIPFAQLPQPQPECIIDSVGATGLIDCGNWSESASWIVPATAVSGVYFARLVREDNGGSSYVFFVVRNDTSHSAIIYQTSDATRAAYNTYGGNSLYQCKVACPPGTPSQYKGAAKVSFNRPNIATLDGIHYSFFGAEFQLIQFLEANGYDISYISGVDTDRLDASGSGALLKNHSVFISSGHDEYWSGNQRANVEAARDAGVHLAFFSGNEVFWKTRYENSIDGSNSPYRTLVSYKETHFNAPVDPRDPPIWTGTWRDTRFSPPADGGRPENALTGTLYAVDEPANFAIEVPAADGKMRFWRNTSVATLADGLRATLAPNTLGYEWDEDADNGVRPAGIVHLSTNTHAVPHRVLDNYGSSAEGPGVATHHLVLHRAKSGVLVFGAGTVQWAWGLSGNPAGIGTVDVRMQQATVNLLADMGVQPASLIPGLVAAAASADFTPPVSAISSPGAGSSVQAGTTVTIIGTASDSGGGIVGGVEISTDGGTTWHPASGRENWLYQWTPMTTGIFTLRSRAVDDSARLETPAGGVSVNVTARSCPCSIWPDTAAPAVSADSDTKAVELGIKFYADNDGVITGIRFFKSSANIGPHVASLWSANGTLLARASFNNESASGWQQVNFASPVPITAGTHYVASYHTMSGRYAADTGYFISSGFDNPPLHALKEGVDGSNGVYLYSNQSGFPRDAYQASNYWVDVVFMPGTGGDTTAPSVITQTPEPGASGLSTSTAPRAQFSESVQPGTITFTLRDAGNALVPATLGYDSSTQTAALTPNAPLAASTTYTVSLSGAADVAGNVMTPMTWSFTTSAVNAAVSCPCTIWPATAIPAVAGAVDARPVELGVKFRSDSNGFIGGIRFYKSTSNTGVHVASLWDTTGKLLARATFANESGSGWQQVNFPSAIAVTAGTTYVASYHTNTGGYAADNGFFAVAGVDNGPLHALREGVAGGNGVYAYSAGSAFPNNSHQSTNYWVDVVFATERVSCPCTLWPSTVVPTYPAAADSRAVEIGVKFRADTSGFITAIRYYKSSTNTGPHIGSLWSTNGTLLARATFTNETAAGWQQVNLATPVSVTVGTTYVASYHTNVGRYAADNDYFAATGVDNGPLHALKNGVDGFNGVYLYSAASAFPVNSHRSSNYWVDVVFTNVPVKCPCTIWPSTVVPVVEAHEPQAIEVGVKFRADADGFIHGVRFYKSLGNTGEHVGTLWKADGTMLTSATFSNESANGWQEVTFSSPVAIVGGTTYVASYHTNTGRYAGDNGYFAGGGWDNGPLHALKDGVDGANGLYAYSSARTFPKNSFKSSNYWVDVVFTPAALNCPCTLWQPAVGPIVADNKDSASIEIGVKFRSDTAGFITGLRFYKSSTNTGTHIAHIWSTSGVLLATATFANETVSGWQQMNFAAPLAVDAGTVYVASYHTDSKHYAGDNNYFANLGVDKPPLHALKDGVAGGNGVYGYGTGLVFPNRTFKSTNYWVDVVFQPRVQ